MLNPKKFAHFLEDRAAKKDGYIMCAIGQDPKTLRDWYFNQYNNDAKAYAKAIYWKEHAERVWDCQGLADGYVTENAGLGTVNVRARNNYATWCGIKGTGVIPKSRRVPGAAVFVHSSSAGYITHVGYLVRPVDENDTSGDWYVVEAKGVHYGVVTTKLSQGKWNRWGWMTKYFDYEAEDNSSEVSMPTAPSRILRNGHHGEDVRTLQTNLIELGYSCGLWGADGDFGDSTELAVRRFQKDNGLTADGKYGPLSHAKMVEVLADHFAPVEDAKVVKIQNGQCYVRDYPATTGKIIGVARLGSALTYRGEIADNGWVAVEYNGKNGWVSGKYGKVC